METFVILHQATGIDHTISGIDEIDRKIIGILREDGRQAATVVGNRLGLSVVSTQRRIKRLLDDGVIRVIAVISPTKVDWYYPAILGISVKPFYAREILKTMSEHPKIDLAFNTLGNFDIIADVDGAMSVDSLHELAEDEISQIEGVIECELFIASETKNGHAWWL